MVAERRTERDWTSKTPFNLRRGVSPRAPPIASLIVVHLILKSDKFLLSFGTVKSLSLQFVFPNFDSMQHPYFGSHSLAELVKNSNWSKIQRISVWKCPLCIKYMKTRAGCLCYKRSYLLKTFYLLAALYHRNTQDHLFVIASLLLGCKQWSFEWPSWWSCKDYIKMYEK